MLKKPTLRLFDCHSRESQELLLKAEKRHNFEDVVCSSYFPPWLFSHYIVRSFTSPLNNSVYFQVILQLPCCFLKC